MIDISSENTLPENILTFPMSSKHVSDEEALQLSMQPFFRAVLPFLPPGIDESYRPGDRKLLHTLEAKQFLQDAAIVFSSLDYASVLNWDVFHQIGKARLPVPLTLSIIFFFEHQWKQDVDGPIKITIDALFTHLKKIAEYEHRQKWNDNRVKRLIVTKEMDAEHPRVEIEVRCFLQLGRAA